MENRTFVILAADDEEELLEALQLFLEREHMKLIKAADGPTALRLFEKEQPDLVLLDVMMPGMDGPEVFRRMQEDERTQGIPVFFMTAVTDRDRVLECMEMNPEEYLVKPVSSSKLLKKLSDLFEKES